MKVFRPETIEQEIGHSALNRICIIAWPRQLFWQISPEFLLDNFFTFRKVGAEYLTSFRKRVLFSQNLGCGLICDVIVCPVQKQGNKFLGSL